MATKKSREFHVTLADIQDAFVGFVNKVPVYGAAVVCRDDAAVAAVLPRIERRVVAYGLAPGAEVSARDVEVGPAFSRYTALAAGQGSLAHALDETGLRLTGFSVTHDESA